MYDIMKRALNDDEGSAALRNYPRILAHTLPNCPYILPKRTSEVTRNDVWLLASRGFSASTQGPQVFLRRAWRTVNPSHYLQRQPRILVIARHWLREHEACNASSLCYAMWEEMVEGAFAKSDDAPRSFPQVDC